MNKKEIEFYRLTVILSIIFLNYVNGAEVNSWECGKFESASIIGSDGTYLGKRPSSEWRFHRDILKYRSDINVVLHSHSLNATSLAIHHKTIPAFHYMVGLAGGNNIRCAKYETFGTQALSDAAIIALKDRLACLLGQHGMICLGKTFEEAFNLATELETLSKIYVKALSIGDTPVLSDEEMVKVIDQMKRMSYGKGPEPEGSNDIARPKND